MERYREGRMERGGVEGCRTCGMDSSLEGVHCVSGERVQLSLEQTLLLLRWRGYVLLSGILISAAKTEKIHTVSRRQSGSTNLRIEVRQQHHGGGHSLCGRWRSSGSLCGLGLPSRAELDSDAVAGQLAS